MCACVCVWNIWTDVKLLPIFSIAGGLEPICLSSPTKLWHFGGWVVWSTTCTCIVMITCCSGFASYLLYFAIIAWEWHPAKPTTGHSFSQSDTFFFTGYLDGYLHASVHFRMLSSGCITSIWALFYLSYLHPGNSDNYFEEDSLISKTGLVLHVWDSVPNRSYEGSIFV